MNYRSVALTNILCKGFERFTNKILVWYLEKKKKIDDRKCGFKNQRSTIDTTPKITTKILNGLRREQKSATNFFNIQKAYDKINRNKTFEQLENMMIQG